MTPMAMRRRNRPVFAVTIVEPLDAMVPTPQRATSARSRGAAVGQTRRGAVRRDGRNPEGPAEQVRAGPCHRTHPLGPDAVHLHPLSGGLRLHREHPRAGRRPARRPGAARGADVPRVPDHLPGHRHVPDDRREGRGRQGPHRSGDRPPHGAPAWTSPTCRSSTGWRSSTSSRPTRTSSRASRSRAPSGSAAKRPRPRSSPRSSARRTSPHTTDPVRRRRHTSSEVCRRSSSRPGNDSAGPSWWTNPLVVEESRLSESNRRPSHYE